ncbi:MAG: polysaccharide deacetylase family protein [Spirochaetes bacterium]|nr:polysaccharide deacetylase family protein [Spirochaetota bacterium]
MGALNSVKNFSFFPLSPFHISGIAAVLFSVVLIFFNTKLAPVPLLLFLIICLSAPFITRLSFFLPVISKGNSGIKAVALTFDDGPDPDVTPAVLKLLAEHSAKAVFFVTGENAERYPHIIRQILAQGHSIGNHSYRHDPFLMLRKTNTLFNEINICKNILQKFGINAFAFRPPAGITNPRLRNVLLNLNMYCVNWSCRGLDAGNRRIKGLAKKILRKAGPDDIILLHDVKPGNKNDINALMNEFKQIFQGLKTAGLNIIPLAEIINTKVMAN